MTDRPNLPFAWEWRREPFRDSWRDAVRQCSDLGMSGVLAQNMAADDFLVSLTDGRVAEVHVGYHAGADLTFESVAEFASFGDWLAGMEG
ncbi:hypothetical protein [Brevundimonas sp.]|uniref:hypothetical protein n=1 Tax=Brevundimonas sp. TaxID=1871086 RepID=UPI0025FCF182|nr:hypothetical protein [Brevundimonas sp.]